VPHRWHLAELWVDQQELDLSLKAPQAKREAASAGKKLPPPTSDNRTPMCQPAAQSVSARVTSAAGMVSHHRLCAEAAKNG
jgi:hypothetical protein